MTDGPEGSEPIEGDERRTRESEIKANIELWTELDVQVDEADVRAKIEELLEVEGFDFYIYLPKGVKTSEVWTKMDERFPIFKWGGIGNLDVIKYPRFNEKDSYAIACRYQQESDNDTLGENAKSALNWEKTKEQFISPIERMVAELRWHKERGTHLDEKNETLCPGSRSQDSKVPYLSYSPDHGVSFYSHPPGYSYPSLGIRRVITKDTKV